MDKTVWVIASPTYNNRRASIAEYEKQMARYSGRDTTRYTRTVGHKFLISIIGLLFLTTSYAQTGRADDQHVQPESETVEFDIPASTLPQALRAFARQSRVELVFAERGFDDVRTQAVVGSFPRERALEMLLAGTGLQVGYGSGNSVIVQRADVPELTGDVALEDADSSMVLLAQAAVDESQRVVNDTAAYGESGDQASAQVSRSRNDERLEEITVTGSRISGAQNASPIVTISRAEIDMAGFATVEDIVENLPQNFGAGATLDSTEVNNQLRVVGGDVGDNSGGTSVNLRGLGAGATLVLLNGHRMSPSGVSAGFTNIASIPVTAIERVEVMTDGASAIYGSDAIGGVINFILRDSYDGAETRLRYGTDARDSTSNLQLGQSFGSSWNSGNVLLTYEYYDSDALASSDRSFTVSNDLSPFGGTDWRQPGGNPANIRVGSSGARVFYAIPEGQDGTALTSADFIGLENTQNFINAREFTDTTPAVEQHSGFLHLKQTVGAVDLFGALRFSTQESATRVPQAVVDFPSVTDASPFFVDPTGTGLTTVRVDNYALYDDFGPLITFGEIESAGATLGAGVEFGDNWRGDFTVNWAEEEGTSTFGNWVATAAELRAAANLTDPDLAFNPFGDGSNTNPVVIESLVERRRFGSSDKNELKSVSFDVNGDVFEMPGGAAVVAAGIDFREESLSTTSDVRTVSRDRDVRAVYAEVFLPLVRDANGRPGLRRLEVSVAARHEDYSDFGDSTNPKLGVLWSPTQSLNLRGTIGTSYRAPSLTDLNDSVNSSWAYFPNVFGLPYAFLQKAGRNSELQAEEATTWTTGFQWNPEGIGGLSLDVTYFNIDFTGRIERPAPNIVAAILEPRFASIVMLDPSDEEIAAFVNDSRYAEDFLLGFGLGPFPATDFGGPGGLPVGAIIDMRLANLAQSVVTGAELQLSYAFDTDIGSFNVGLNGSYLFDFERKLLATDPLVDEVDTLGRPVDLRARGNISWIRNRWSISGFVNYTDGYTDNVSDPVRAVDSWTTVDLTVAYETGSDAGLLSDTRVSLTTQNLFDEDPPFVDTFGGVGYDATSSNPLGQFFALQITKDW